MPVSSSPSSSSSGVVLALLAALSFSTLGIWGKLASGSGLGSFNTLCWRFGLVALVLLPFSSKGMNLRQRGKMLGVGLLYALATTCYFGALGCITAGTTGLLLYLAPAFVIVLGRVLGQRVRPAQLWALVFALAGLGLVVGLPGPADKDVLGLSLGAGAGLMYAVYLLASERLGSVSALASTAHMALAASLYFGLLAAGTGQLSVPQGAQWGPVLGMVALPTLIAVPALYGAVARIGAAQASLLGTLEPLFTVVLAFAVLHEPLRASVLLGGSLILVGAALASWSPGARKGDY